jgi:glycerol-3-phosphate dehydrogenase
LMPARFVGAERNGQCCKVEIETGKGQESISCRVLVNCAGPWAGEVLKRITPSLVSPSIELVQGSHLLLPPLLDQYFYLEAPQDKRAVFVLPWEGRLLVGTTERVYTGAPERAACSPEERDYLLATLRHYFPQIVIPAGEIETFAGLRVLPKSDKTAFARPREVMFAVDNEAQPRVLSVMGGKLTTYRATAQAALERLAPSLPTKERRADTALVSLIPVH